MSDTPDLDDAYAVQTPDDNRRLYRSWAATYEDDFMASHGYVYHARVTELFAADASPDDEPVLDVGCGTGVGGVELRRHGSWIIDGLDISPEMLDRAADKRDPDGTPLYRDLIEADLTRPLTIDDGTYGAVVSAGTFTHGHVGPDALDELFRIVRPGGILCLGINEAHFEARRFDEAFAAAVEAGTVTEPELTQIAMYDASPDAHDHADDTALVALCRRR